MHPEVFEIAALLSLLTGIAFALKLMIFGKGPIRRRLIAESEELLSRISELEERQEFLLGEIGKNDDSRIAELEERLDFAERLLTNGQPSQDDRMEDVLKQATPV